jgi:hypothetical protein
MPEEPPKDERTIDEMADDYTKRFLASLNQARRSAPLTGEESESE